ncbi:putative sodium-dependent transporter [Schistosoma japonicum]|uniref:Putative sodium-dependent transporter n=1 Tax=Schistosoma japonicum TaxID=6182 RepID=A0A4Z2DU75_SCHJA|nr:putative sodium-dependent transporter [Schistosoma japonicum]
MFQSVLGAIISCLGSAVGTGNIWRFPRILASHSHSTGALAFYIVWIIILFLWSIPIIIVEYSIGRFTRNSVTLAFCKFFGQKFFWLGGWMLSIVFFVSGYYPVILGWCIYYLYLSCTLSSLPTTEEAGSEIFSNFTQHSYWPVFTQVLAVALSGICLLGGIKWIEKVNMVLVPLLLAIVIFTFAWSLTRQYAEVGITFLFTPSWSSLLDPSMWIAAAGQNAFDTNAGMAVLATYSTFMSRDSRIISYSFLIPIVNNLVSFFASITIFSTVFSTIIQTNPTATRSAIVRIMKTAGPGSTGLTFTWIPVLFSKVGVVGRVLCVLFFLCLVFAGVSSLLSLTQVHVLAMKEFNVPHRLAVGIALLASLIVGLPSAIKLEFLTNQDNTWGYGLIVSGLLFCLIVIIYGPNRYRRVLINDYGIDDCHLSVIWVPIIAVLVPLQSITLLVWWIYESIKTDPNWYILTWDTISTTLLEWLILLICLLILNYILYRTNLLSEALKRSHGCDPYDPSTYVDKHEFDVDEIEIGETNVFYSSNTVQTRL